MGISDGRPFRLSMSPWSPSSSPRLLQLQVLLIIIGLQLYQECNGMNLPPFFKEDLNNLVIPENTPIGTPVFKLVGIDPEKSRLRYGIMGTDKLTVDERTGVVTIAKSIDRESEDRLKVSVTVEDDDAGNVVPVKNVIQISDLNDNAPIFVNKSSYESVEVIEDARVGSRILSILIEDPDLTGLELRLNCTPTHQSPEACRVFPIEILEATSGRLTADLKLGQKLDYNRRSLYQFILAASDGEHVSTAAVLIRVQDVQNTPPVFVGAMSGRIMEDSPVGTLVMVIEARDGDLGNPRKIKLSILRNPGDSFQLDASSGQLITTRPLDRETLGSLLKLEVKAEELRREDGPPADTDIMHTVANVSILIDDVNDYAPQFNHKEFWTEITENTPAGTPLPELDMMVSDEDSGNFADFTLRIDGPLSEYFEIEPKIGSGSVRPVIRVKKAFDYENPNERKFLIPVIAQNMEEPELSSSCTVSVSTIDENDNKPKFIQDVFTISVPESAQPGTQIGRITATDPDSKEFGNEGLVYQLVGAGNKKFSVNPKTGEISVAECPNAADNHTVTVASCLDFEAQKSYDLLFMASDSHRMEGYIHSIVPLHILLTDSNDNQPYFDSKFHRTVLENAPHFEPRFYIRAKDIDQTALIAYKLQSKGTDAGKYFQLDETTAELTIRNVLLPPGNFSFNVTASDGLFEAVASVFIAVLDVNNNYPVFKSSLKRNLNISEDAEIGALLTQLQATDVDLDRNGKVHFGIEAGSYGFFDIDKDTGKITLAKELDDSVRPTFDLVVSAYDLGTPPLRTTTVLHVQVKNVYSSLPEIFPKLQRAQVSESAKIGDVIARIGTTNQDPAHADLKLKFEFVLPMEARNLDNKAVPEHEVFKDWFQISDSGEVSVSGALAREIVTGVNLTVLLTSETSRPGSKSFGTLAITIFDVNNLPPRIEDVEIETYEELPPGMTILTLACEDPEGGQISSYYIGEGSEFVSVDNKTGEIKVAGRLDFEDRPMYNLTVVCVDSGLPQLSSTGTVMVSVLNINDNTPTFNQSSYSAEIDEHAGEGTIVTSVSATDADGDVIYYEIEPTSKYSAAFKIDRLGQITVSKEGGLLLDRETMKSPFLTLGIRAKDSEHHGFTTVHVSVRDLNDNWPKMLEKSYQGTVYAPLYFMQEILKVRAEGGDEDETDEMRFEIQSGNDLGVFDIEPRTGVIRATRAHEDAGEFQLIVQVTDRKGDMSGNDHYDRTGIRIRILPGNFRKPEFKFPNRVNSTLPVLESSEAEIVKFTDGDYTKVLGQLLAFDQDEGEAGELQFYFKDGDSLISETEEFRVETETGRIHQIRPLDREKMNRYNLVVVAKDNGKPVSTETHEVLNIIVEDIEDNQPKFDEVREYNFSIKENSFQNTFIGQVEAKDEDDGRNAQVFYFLVATDENQHFIHNDFRVDIKSGSIYTNAVLDHERRSSYLFFVRASASPMVNKSAEIMEMADIIDEPSVAIVRVQVQDLNDNSPRFPFREYYAGISSNAEPGREILTFSSTDVDPSSQPFIQYSLLASQLVLDDVNAGGAVLPSPFRVDENTGRLTLSRTAMRRYAGGGNKFLVKVGVKETIPPFYADTTQVRVWVVEDNQEAILTIKTPPTEMLREELTDLLGNITGRLILINKVTPHVREDRTVNKLWSDVYVTAVDKKSNQILPVPELLQALDMGHDKLRKSGVSIELFSAVPAMGSTEADGHFFFNDRESFDTAFAGLVALVALLCMGLATILAVCCCLNRMYSSRSEKGSQMSSGMKYPLHPGGSLPGTPTMSRILKPQPEMIEDLATDNPLWIDHKLKTYEEQELTMQVASDLENSNSTEDGMSLDEDPGAQPGNPHHPHRQLQRQSSPQFSHSYATIHQHPATDYDNIHNLLGDDTGAVHL